MRIINSTTEDIDTMLRFYDWGRELQQSKSMRHWKNFDRRLLEKEIEEKRQWKIMENNTVICIFLTAYDDPHIWGERNGDPSVYLHRIVTHPQHRGKNLMK